MIEMRKHQRFKLNRPLTLRVGNIRLHGILHDISAGGIGMEIFFMPAQLSSRIGVITIDGLEPLGVRIQWRSWQKVGASFAGDAARKSPSLLALLSELEATQSDSPRKTYGPKRAMPEAAMRSSNAKTVVLR